MNNYIFAIHFTSGHNTKKPYRITLLYDNVNEFLKNIGGRKGEYYEIIGNDTIASDSDMSVIDLAFNLIGGVNYVSYEN